MIKKRVSNSHKIGDSEEETKISGNQSNTDTSNKFVQDHKKKLQVGSYRSKKEEQLPSQSVTLQSKCEQVATNISEYLQREHNKQNKQDVFELKLQGQQHISENKRSLEQERQIYNNTKRQEKEIWNNKQQESPNNIKDFEDKLDTFTQKSGNCNDAVAYAKQIQKMSVNQFPLLKNVFLKNMSKQQSPQNQPIDKKQGELFQKERTEAVERVKEWFLKLENDEEDNILSFFKGYKVQNEDIISINKLMSSPNLQVKVYQKSIYFGEIINGQHNGIGILIHKAGKIYEGEWQNDLKFGKGYEMNSNGNQYLGFFVNGKSEGLGTFLWLNGEVYEGQWLRGFKHGSGIWRGPKGDSYIGEWKMGKADGYGVHSWVNGDQYEGEFKVCLKHGKGKEKFKNGDCYQGNYINGKPEGYGEYFWKNGNEYKGQFKNGLRHGKGIWKKKQEGGKFEMYSGEYKSDKKCGYGEFNWSSGNKYIGNFFDDMRDGYGEMCWIDGTVYKGQWEKGLQCGEGELNVPGEDPIKGLFANSQFNKMIDEKRPNSQKITNKREISKFGKIKDNHDPNYQAEKENKQQSPIKAIVERKNYSYLEDNDGKEQIIQSPQKEKIKHYSNEPTCLIFPSKNEIIIPELLQNQFNKRPVLSLTQKQKQQQFVTTFQGQMIHKNKREEFDIFNNSLYAPCLSRTNQDMKFKKKNNKTADKKGFSHLYNIDIGYGGEATNYQEEIKKIATDAYENRNDIINRSQSTWERKTNHSSWNQHQFNKTNYQNQIITSPNSNHQTHKKLNALQDIPTDASNWNIQYFSPNKTQLNLLFDSFKPNVNQQEMQRSTNFQFRNKSRNLSPLNEITPLRKQNEISPSYSNSQTPLSQQNQIVPQYQDLKLYLQTQEQNLINQSESKQVSPQQMGLYSRDISPHGSGIKHNNQKRSKSVTTHSMLNSNNNARKLSTPINEKTHNGNNFFLGQRKKQRGISMIQEEMPLCNQKKAKLNLTGNHLNKTHDPHSLEKIKGDNKPVWKPVGNGEVKLSPSKYPY